MYRWSKSIFYLCRNSMRQSLIVQLCLWEEKTHQFPQLAYNLHFVFAFLSHPFMITTLCSHPVMMYCEQCS